MANKLKQYNDSKNYGAMCAMLADIQNEIAPQLSAMRKADALLDNCAKGRPQTGTNETEAGSLEKYGHIYSMGTMPGSLAKENNSFAGLLTSSMDKAVEDTRSNAGGANARE